MAFINYENLPSENTPLTGGDGGNLNEMQKIVNISNEVDEDYRVNLLETKNLFNKDSFNVLNGLISDGGTLASNQYFRTLFIKCKPSTTYTTSKISSNYFRVGGFASVPTLGASYISREKDDTSTSITYTTPSNCNYLAITYYDSNSDNNLQAILDSIQIEEGNEASTYEAFVPNQILVDNEKYTDTLNVGSVVDSRSKVNVLKSNNLFDFNISQISNGMWYDTTTGKTTSNPNGWYIIKPIEPNKTYTLSRKNIQDNNGLHFAVCTTSSYPTSNMRYVDLGAERGSTVKEIHLTTSSTARYIVIFLCGRAVSDMNDTIKNAMIEELQVEYGSAATSYEPYITPSIYVDNEEIYSKPVVLWTNSSPTSNFAGQTITLGDSLDNYSFYEISFYNSTSNTQSYSTGKIKSNVKTTLYYLSGLEQGGNAMIRYRDITGITNTTITFGTPYYKLLGQTSITEGSNQTVPYKIIGYK